MRKKILGKNKEKRTQKLFITAKMRLLPITPNQLILKVLSAKHANVTIIYQRGAGHIKKGKNKKHEKFFLINFLYFGVKFPLLDFRHEKWLEPNMVPATHARYERTHAHSGSLSTGEGGGRGRYFIACFAL